ncbi:hypothetical protein H5410_030188, partial [Solanum commersonii]
IKGDLTDHLLHHAQSRGYEEKNKNMEKQRKVVDGDAIMVVPIFCIAPEADVLEVDKSFDSF